MTFDIPLLLVKFSNFLKFFEVVKFTIYFPRKKDGNAFTHCRPFYFTVFLYYYIVVLTKVDGYGVHGRRRLRTVATVIFIEIIAIIGFLGR